MKKSQKILPEIRNLVWDELGREVIRKHNEKLKGTGLEHKYIYKNNHPISFSNPLEAISFNQILTENNLGVHILSPIETIIFWSMIPKKDKTFADTASIVIYRSFNPNEDLKKNILEIIGKKKITKPLIVSGLGVKKSNKPSKINDYLFRFTETENTKIMEANYIKNYPLGILIPSEENIKIKAVPSGIRGIYRDHDVGLDARDPRLVGETNKNSRVQIIDNYPYSYKLLEEAIKNIN